MKHLVVVVDWYGPFSPEEARKAAADFEDGLYLGIGRRHYQHGPSTPQYIGLSKNLPSRLANHHKLPEITRDARLWLGEVASSNVPGKKAKKTPETLSLAEWSHAYFLALPLNERKRKKPPSRPVTVLSRWWRADYQTQWVKRPHPEWPELIDYLGPEHPARLVWFGKNQKRIKPPFVSG